MAQVADRVGVTTHSLYAWIRKFGPDSEQHQVNADDQSEIRRLQKELKRVTEERAILKKPWRTSPFSPIEVRLHSEAQRAEANPQAPDESWVTDITYVRTHEGWLYLAVVLDLFSRRVIGWSMQSRITKELALDALLMAVWRRQPEGKVIVHSDQGSQ